MVRRPFMILSVLLIALAMSAALHANGRASDESQRTYLALGDSVAFGFIDHAGYAYLNPTNFIGYPEYVGEALELKTANAACSGETTGSFLVAGAPDDGCREYRGLAPLHVPYASTQAQYALTYLVNHPDTSLVTIDLGANDIFLLQAACNSDSTCIANGLPQLLTQIYINLTTILSGIRHAGYTGIIVVVNYFALDYRDLASTEITVALNQSLAAAAQANGALVADVFTAFQKFATTTANGATCKAGLLNASVLDQFTCDVHPSQSGQKLIARTVEAAVGTVTDPSDN